MRRGGKLSPGQRQDRAGQSNAEQGCGGNWWGPRGDRQGNISEAMGQSAAQHQHLGRGRLTLSLCEFVMAAAGN